MVQSALNWYDWNPRVLKFNFDVLGFAVAVLRLSGAIRFTYFKSPVDINLTVYIIFLAVVSADLLGLVARRLLLL